MAKLKRHHAFTIIDSRVNHLGTKTYACQCVCGTVKWIVASKLVPELKSCGCIKRKAGDLKRRYPKEHNSWMRMKRRCYNPKSKDYYGYGSEGITVAKKWHKFERFIKDMGPCPAGCNSLDRIKNHKGYEPGNVRWSNPIEQANNRTNNRHITIGGVKKTLSQWSRATGVKAQTIARRLDRGHSVEQSLLSTLRKVQVINLQTGETFESMREAEVANGVARGKISAAIKRGGRAGGYYWALAC